jgi:hypothetical protein
VTDEVKDFRYYADKAETYINMADDIPTIKGQQVVVAVAAIYAELAKAAPKVEPEPKYIVMTPVEAEMKAATDKKFATKLRRRSLTPEDRDVLRAFSETSEDRKQG